MRINKEIKAEISGERLVLEDVIIGGEKYDICIENFGSCLFLYFKKYELSTYQIMIKDDNKLSLRRLVRRINHDHDDFEILTKSLEWEKLDWNIVKEERLEIPFGMRTSKI